MGNPASSGVQRSADRVAQISRLGHTRRGYVPKTQLRLQYDKHSIREEQEVTTMSASLSGAGVLKKFISFSPAKKELKSAGQPLHHPT